MKWSKVFFLVSSFRDPVLNKFRISYRIATSSRLLPYKDSIFRMQQVNRLSLLMYSRLLFTTEVNHRES